MAVLRRRYIFPVLAAIALLCASATASARTLVVTNQYGSSGLYSYSVDPGTGVPTQISGTPAAAGFAPSTPSISPDGTTAFAAGYSNGTLRSFSFDSGTQTFAPTGSTAATGSGPNAAIVSLDGSAVWTADYEDGTVSRFDVASGGALTVQNPATNVGGGPTTLAQSPRNTFVYVPDSVNGTVDGFESTPGSSSLTHLTGFPISAGAVATDVEFSTDGRYLFVVAQGDDEVNAFRVNQSTGALTALDSYTTGDGPGALAASPDGKWLLVNNAFADTVSVFAISSAGTLSQVGTAIPTGGVAPWDATFSPDSRFAYVTNYFSNSISAFAIDADGAATALAGSPYAVAATGYPFSLAIQPNQGPTAAFSNATDGLTVGFNAAGSSDSDGSVATYRWDFGDGVIVTTNSAQTTHRYSGYGSYGATLTVTDNEGCSKEQIGTGQSVACNGSASAVTSQTITLTAPVTPPPPPPPPAMPLVLNRVSATQVFKAGSSTKRIRVRYSLTGPAKLSLRFYIQRGNGYRRFGGTIVKNGRSNANSFHIVNRIGGRRIANGRYRVSIAAVASDGTAARTRSARFGVR
jgi:6-phosphogluconolactonase (cycloisomerase 2 family)